jgi:uncharacterized protein YjbI with pentapeptide repeats
MPRKNVDSHPQTPEENARTQAHRELLELLQKVSEGILSPEEAEKKVFEMGSFSGFERSVKEGFQQAFERLKRTVQADDRFQGMQNFAQGIGRISFVSQTAGVDATLSSLQSIEKDDSSKVAQNHIVGCQWFQVSFKIKSQFVKNLFTAVQFSELEILAAAAVENVCSLSRLSNTKIESSELRNNRINRSSFSDVVMIGSHLVRNKIQKSAFLQVNLESSQVVSCRFVATEFRDCEFKDSRIESVTFEECVFSDCSFDRFSILGRKDSTLKGMKCVGLHFEGSMTWDQFNAAVVAPPSEV